MQALVTCTRNQAVEAVVDKISKVDGSILVFGHDKRLGERAKRYTLEARVARDPNVVSSVRAACMQRGVRLVFQLSCQPVEIMCLECASAATQLLRFCCRQATPTGWDSVQTCQRHKSIRAHVSFAGPVAQACGEAAGAAQLQRENYR